MLFSEILLKNRLIFIISSSFNSSSLVHTKYTATKPSLFDLTLNQKYYLYFLFKYFVCLIFVMSHQWWKFLALNFLQTTVCINIVLKCFSYVSLKWPIVLLQAVKYITAEIQEGFHEITIIHQYFTLIVLVSTMQINTKAMPTNGTDYSCHINKSCRICLTKHTCSTYVYHATDYL